MARTEERGAGRSAPAIDLRALLAGDDWKSLLPAALSAIGSEVGADRCYVFENLRGPDGRLWMDLIAEWTAEGVRSIFEQSGGHLHPYFPDFQAWMDVLGHGLEVVGRVDRMEEPTRSMLASEGTVSTWLIPIGEGETWWGHVGFDLTDDRRWRPDVAPAMRALTTAVGESVVRQQILSDRSMRQDLFRTIVEEGPVITYIDAPDEVASSVYVSPQIEDLVGYTVEEWMNDPELWPRLLHPDDRARALAENVRHNETGEPYRLEYRMIHRDGHVVWVYDEARVVRDEDGKVRYSHGVMLDITGRKTTDDQVAFRTYHDELTGLPSREMFEELVELSVARARRHEGAVAVLCVDLIDFRLVNDSLGHVAGDGLLVAVADRLREATRETDLVARRGGDQFLLLLADLDRDESGPDGAVLRAESVAQRINQAFAEPFVVDETEVYISAGVGISLFPRDADAVATLIRNAESAMFEAKRTGGAAYVLSGGAEADSSARLHFVTRLRKAVDAQRWTLYYQPVIDLQDGRMVGVEALIRWIEPDGTMIPPNDFIPLAEELGLIERIGDWVVRELTFQVAAWRELDIDLEVGFNLSPRQFWQPDLARRIQHEFRSGGVDPSRVMVEVTETSAMMDPDRAQGILHELRDAGFAIAIDDFGTGYSSLSRLRHMPVRVLKIDRSFVSNVHTDRQAASIVSAFLELANGLDLVTLAEGIETEEELAFLREKGCRLGQGYFFSRPVPPEEIIAYVFGGIPTAAALRSA
jgi:diguanylate cyclase (GGDEF)-like protein/PAS domain S-box-containing protein